MEFPSFNNHHHHNRYVPPPPPAKFSDDRPNLYPHHQHLLPSLHLPPPPPLAYPSLPLPPPPPLPVPPPPPSYNPHQSHFTFLDAQNPSFSNHGRASPPQPRFSNQSHRFNYRTDAWSDSHRIPPELTHRNPILPDDHHRRLYSPDTRSENHYKPHISERVIPSSRYRDESISNGYAVNNVSQEQQVFRGSSNNDDHHGRVIDRYASTQATGSNSRNLDEFVEKYEPCYITNSENERVWDQHGERAHQMKGKKNEFGHNDGAFGREESQEYEYESSGVSRVRDEFKQVQKKSVLLRIGKPNNTNRNRSHDQHFSKAHMAESNNSSFRGKDKDRDCRMEGDREQSPVELDVSFKSNALVAKAVVTPSSPVNDNKHTQQHNRNKKTKKTPEFDSPLKRLDSPSSSEMASKQQKVKEPGNDGALVLGQGGPLSFRLKKKRKLINFKNSPSVSIFQLAEKDDKSVKVENKNSPSASSIQDAIPSKLEEPVCSKIDKVSCTINDLSQDEVSLNVENDTTQQVFTLDHVTASSGQKQDQIEVQKEAFASFDGCSAEIITLVSENENGSTLDNAVVTGKSYNKDSEIQSDLTTPDEKHDENVLSSTPTPKVISLDEDEIVELHSESVSKPEDEIVEIVELSEKDHLLPSSSILSTPSDTLTSIVSSFSKDQTISDAEKLVPEDGGLFNCRENSKTSIKPSHLVNTSQSQGLNTKMLIKKPYSASTTVFATRPSPVFTNSRINNSSKSIAKPRTWHRSVHNNNNNNNNTTSVPRPPKQVGTVQNAYIRSGNTLVRKGTSVTTISSVPSASRSSSNPIETRTSAVVRPKTPPLSASGDSTTIRVLPSSPLEDQNCTTTSSNSETQKTLLDQGKKIEYVKPKSNQLVAASTSDNFVQELAPFSTDGYYKRRKNQLIRTLVGDDSATTDVGKINIKRQSGKGILKKYRHSRFSSSVWTLGGKDSSVSLSQKLRPHLFPWKRSKYWGNVSASIQSNNSSSLISRKLLVSRKRDMIYTRSKHGFSLRMSKLMSVGGSSLKWSKSIEKNSKRANEEATLAVAAAEKKRREQHLYSQVKSRNNNNNNNSMSRDRIFRIGLVRYKMDSSRRTLQRISDEEPSTSNKSKEEMRRCFVPKRLLIGQDEYLRIGNGNQLVRNPKRRTRLFANEKVRWSLHTARARLARKKKYCQFFTRFGKCNKDDGKCHYIHDSSKIAVCTKFLKGLCSNPDCNLTHKVIPERMQDCSYFLQGFCSNQHCPYRHVNVNSAASICEGFLKGFCADGNECRKKHTYACPVFEATGECSQPTKCKLHHSKNRSTGLKRKHQNTTQHQKNSKGRYFGAVSGGSGSGDVLALSQRHHLKDDDQDSLCQLAEYITLDSCNEDFGDVISDQRTLVYSEPLDLGEVDLDDLTKPIGIMKKLNLGVVSLHEEDDRIL